jgi:hypothetical protein
MPKPEPRDLFPSALEIMGTKHLAAEVSSFEQMLKGVSLAVDA